MEKQWRLIDWSVCSIRILLFLSLIAYYALENPLDQTLTFIIPWFVLSWLIPHLFWRPGYLHHRYYALAEIICVGSLSIYSNLFAPTTFFMLSSFMIGFLFHKKELRWAAPTMLIAIPVVEGFVIGSFLHFLLHLLTYSTAFAAGSCLFWLDTTKQRLEKVMKENEEKAKVIEAQNRSLTHYAQQVEQLTIAEERNRIARELHDTLGHTLTSSIVSIEAALHLMDQAPDKAREKLSRLHHALIAELEVVRSIVHETATHTELNTLEEQASVVLQRFSVLTSSDVQFTIQGKERKLHSSIKNTLIRCLQEALTNAKRHGHATECRVTLAFTPQQISLTVSDNGNGAEHLKYGFGLNSMDQRLRLLQGNLHIESKLRKGTTVTCTLPLEE